MFERLIVLYFQFIILALWKMMLTKHLFDKEMGDGWYRQ